MGPVCFWAALGHDGMTYLSFFFFLFLDRFLVSSRSLLSLRLHISQRSASGITPLKSLSAVPTAAMTTVRELCVSETVSVIVCLIANLSAVCACMCVRTVWTHDELIFLFLF